MPQLHDGECPPDGFDYYGQCLGACRECGDHLHSTGRYTPYCPSCDTCPDCGCPQADGFEHYDSCDSWTYCSTCDRSYTVELSLAYDNNNFCSMRCEDKHNEEEEYYA